ncbi:MAG: HoxN/HupN/NixA family nickel/cobalt transporter [Paenibacillaceae bacterium]|nr:HoxN/HupN/NixA family nickel/cobalt transporter [Paenibacillaceae bacterium]
MHHLWKERRSWSGYFLVVIALHIVGVIGLLSVSNGNAAFWSMGVLAYTLGLRHAFDADHIAAIDNTVRKLVQQKRSPYGVGFYFSLGHSSVVFLMVLSIALSIRWMQNNMPEMQEIGGIVGMTVSGAFLVLIGIVNLVILVQLLRMFRNWRSGRYREEELERVLDSRGLLSRLIAPLLKFVGRSWHVYPLGFLFGLGFDTATEIGLLAISATAAGSHVSVFGIVSLPILFAAGMSLMDTADGVFMTTAYRWAFATPLRKLYYNVTVTAVSVAAALLIGGVELVQIASEKFAWHSPIFDWFGRLDFEYLGYVLAGLFVVAWVVSVSFWKMAKVEKRYSA